MLTERPLPNEPRWPEGAPPTGPVLVLVDASSRVEEAVITAWVGRQAPAAVGVESISLASSRRRRRPTDARLAERMGRGDDPFLLPVRMAWSPNLRRGRRSASWVDLLKLGDPRDPDPLRQRVILSRWPDRATIVTGAGASASRLVAEHETSSEVTSLTDFVTRRAWLALERSERELRGNRYKVPRFVHDEILSRSQFRDGAVRHGSSRGLAEPVALARARHYLREMAATHSPFLIDLIANAIHWLYRQGYGGLIYDQAAVAGVAGLGRGLPLVFLPSHRSNLDRLALQYLKWENDLPPNHTAGGINMNFFPIGPLIRRTGVFFIRRSFKENDLYKFVLRTYLDYLVESRFPLEWYLEGGRSRSGKLLPPRMGLLSYVVDAWRRGKAEDLMLVPVSIVYDQIQDVGAYASEASGAGKEKESFSWAWRAIRSLRRRYGDIHVRFAEPISVAKALAGVEAGGESIDLAKLAFEVMHRIALVTPITPAAVVSIALLGAGGKARSLAELTVECRSLDLLIEMSGFPTSEPLRLEDPGEVARVLNLLAEHGNVSRFQGASDVFFLQGDQPLRASYYRNVVVHHFLPRGVAELALAVAAKPEAFWEEVARLRDLLKFEFFFPEKDAFRELIRADLDRAVPGWEEGLGKRKALIRRLQPKVAGWAVVPFLESYLVLADELSARADHPIAEAELIPALMRRGGEYRLKAMVAADAVSTAAFRHSLALANHRQLLDAGMGKARAGLAAEVGDVLARARDL
jgi:glycerol-3-phosphate O-acyltransferase